MDYEKAYKAVLKTATQWIKDGCTDKERICLESVFPELRESEDERIRKVLVNEISGWSDVYKMFKYAPKEKVLAWLEKHKELIDPFDTKLFQDGVKEGRRLEREDMEKEQKPAEWSEEDKQWLSDVYFVIDHSMYSEDERQAMKKYIDSLRTQPKPTEWSEEDETIRRNLMSLLVNMRGDRITEETYQKYYPWLKSLRPHWKPSEGQPQVAGVGKMEPEVDLEKEYKTWWNSISGKINIEHMMEWYMHETARHFYKLGLKARKEE